MNKKNNNKPEGLSEIASKLKKGSDVYMSEKLEQKSEKKVAAQKSSADKLPEGMYRQRYKRGLL